MKWQKFIVVLLLCVGFVNYGYSDDIILSDSIEKIIKSQIAPEMKVELMLNLLKEPEIQYLEGARDYAEAAYKIADQTGFVQGKIKAMVLLSNSDMRMSNYKSALETAQRAKNLAETYNYREELAWALRIIGSIHIELGDHNNSSRYYFQALEIFESLGHSEGRAQALGDIGMDFYHQGEYQKALSYYNKALVIAQSVNNIATIKRLYNNIAGVYGDLLQSDTAIYFLNRAIEINLKLGDQLGVGTNIMNIGSNYLNKEEYSQALSFFKSALGIFQNLNNRSRMAECYLNMGLGYLFTNDFDQGIENLNNAIKVAFEVRYFKVILIASQTLNKVYTEEKHDTLKAYNFLLLEKQASDSLYDSQSQKQLTKLELQYQFKKTELERSQKQRTRNMIVTGVILSLLAVLVIMFLSVSRHRLKTRYAVLGNEKMGLELETRKRELSAHLLSLIRKNEMLSGISEELIRLERVSKNNETLDVINIISKMLRTGTDDKLIEEFTTQFQEVHAGFYKKLLQLFPDLTQNELKLCAFLRLNMATKDISELTGQQLSTIDKARYRLRKKLGISNSETNLVAFLSQL